MTMAETGYTLFTFWQQAPLGVFYGCPGPFFDAGVAWVGVGPDEEAGGGMGHRRCCGPWVTNCLISLNRSSFLSWLSPAGWMMARWSSLGMPVASFLKSISLTSLSHSNLVRTSPGAKKLKMLALLQSNEFPERSTQMWPVSGWHRQIFHLVSMQLGNDNFCCWCIQSCLCNVTQAVYFGMLKFPFERAKAPIRCKLHMAHQHEWQGHFLMAPRYHMPQKVLQYGIILVLAAAVICMQMSSSLPEAVLLEEKVKQADDCVGSFSSLDSFMEKKHHLLWQRFCHHTKHSTLPESFAVDGPWLHGIRWAVHLLGKIKTVVAKALPGTVWQVVSRLLQLGQCKWCCIILLK